MYPSAEICLFDFFCKQTKISNFQFHKFFWHKVNYTYTSESSLNQDKCQSICCGNEPNTNPELNDSSELNNSFNNQQRNNNQQIVGNNNFYLNDVFLVEPDSINIVTTASTTKSTTSTYTKTTTDASKGKFFE